MGKVSLGPPIPIPNGIEAPQPIDLGDHQRAIVTQLQQDQRRLVELNEERERVIARIHAGRGKLDLIAELAQQVGAPRVEDTPAPH